VMDRVAAAVGAKPAGGMSASDVPLTPAQQARAKDIIRSINLGGAGGATPPEPPPNTPPARTTTTGPTQQVAQRFPDQPAVRPSQADPAVQQLDRLIEQKTAQLPVLGRSKGAERMYEKARLDIENLKDRRKELVERLDKEREKMLGPGFSGAEASAKGEAEYAVKSRMAAIGAASEAARGSRELDILGTAIEGAGPNLLPGQLCGIAQTIRTTAQALFPSMNLQGIADVDVVKHFNRVLGGEVSREAERQGTSLSPLSPAIAGSVGGTKYLIWLYHQMHDQQRRLGALANRTPTDKWLKAEQDFWDDPKNKIKKPVPEFDKDGNPTRPPSGSQHVPGLGYLEALH